MPIDEENRHLYVEQAHALIDALESGQVDDAGVVLDDLTKMRETGLFQELGKLTRELHNTLTDFHLDSRLSELTESEIPDAKERLNHVITMTEQAANKTLTVVESTFPRTEQLEKRAADLKSKWDRFRSRDMKVEEFRGLSQEIDEFLSWTSDNATHIHQGMTEVMMAQDFQDLTGQIIRRVINLVQEVEDGLVDLVRITGRSIKKEDTPTDGPRDIAAEGPQVPKVGDAAKVVANQDDVDDLLSSLGF